MLAFTYWGIGGADFVWTKAVTYMESHAGQISPVSSVDDAENLARGALLSQVIRHYRVQHMGLSAPTVTSQFYPDKGKSQYGKASILGPSKSLKSGSMVVYFEPTAADKANGIRKSDFGEFRFPCQAQDAPVCQARTQGIISLLTDMDPPAKKIVSTIGGGQGAAQVAGQLKSQSMENAVIKYNQGLAKAIDQQVKSYNSEYKTDIKNFANVASDRGFAFAGAWYWTIAKFNRKAGEAIVGSPSYKEPDFSGLADLGSSDLMVFKDVANTYVNVSQEKMQHIAQGPEKSGVWPKLAAFFAPPFSSIDPIAALGLNEDPVLAMQSVGNKIIGAVEAVVGVAAAADLAAHGASSAVNNSKLSWIPLVGAAAAGAAAVVKRLLEYVVTITGFLLVPMFVLGMVLAYYLPSVPFLLVTSSVLSFLILFMESVVAAPLWAIAHIDGSSEGITGERAKTGYMLFFALLIRPTLMIFGFCISYLVFSAIGWFLHLSFTTFAAGLRAGSVNGIVTFISLTILIGSVTIVYAHKIFGLVTWLPDNVIRWVGQQMQNLGEQQDVEQTRGHFHGAAGFVYNSGSSSRKALQDSATKPSAEGGEANESTGGTGTGARNSEGVKRDVQQGDVGYTV